MRVPGHPPHDASYGGGNTAEGRDSYNLLFVRGYISSRGPSLYTVKNFIEKKTPLPEKIKQLPLNIVFASNKI